MVLLFSNSLYSPILMFLKKFFISYRIKYWESNMKKVISLLSVILLFSLFCITGCAGNGEDLGELLKFNNGELFYTSNISQNRANKLGNYLVESGYFDGNRKTVQIDKSGNTYKFRMVVKKGLEDDSRTIKLLRLYSKELSSNVFGGNPVDIHLCDVNLKTLRVVVSY